jgi:DNA-binding NarL/FixJ family response regulator
MNDQCRIVIIEDNDIVREGFAVILENEAGYTVVNAYDNCEAALENLKNDAPWVVLMDIELPGMNGIRGTREIKKRLPGCEVLVISVYEDNDLVFDALCAGACGYVTKNLGATELVHAVTEAIKGGAPMSTKIAKMVVQSFRKSATSPLSERESEVLELLAKGKTYTMIAEALFISKETARSHIKNIYLKLEVNCKSDALEVARKNRLI